MGCILLVLGMILPHIPAVEGPIYHLAGRIRTSQLWEFFRLGGFFVILWGLAKTLVLRHQERLVREAKDAAGLLGEVETAAELGKLGDRYRVLNRFFLHHRGRVHEFDHVVVGPTGIFHVESKNWAGQIRISDHGVDRSVKGDYHNPMEQLYHHHELLQALLNDNGLRTPDVIGVLCFTNQRANVEDHRRGGTRADRRQTRRPSAVEAGEKPTIHVTNPREINHFIRTNTPNYPLSRRDIAQVTAVIVENSRQHNE